MRWGKKACSGLRYKSQVNSKERTRKRNIKFGGRDGKAVWEESTGVLWELQAILSMGIGGK